MKSMNNEFNRILESIQSDLVNLKEQLDYQMKESPSKLEYLITENPKLLSFDEPLEFNYASQQLFIISKDSFSQLKQLQKDYNCIQEHVNQLQQKVQENELNNQKYGQIEQERIYLNKFIEESNQFKQNKFIPIVRELKNLKNILVDMRKYVCDSLKILKNFYSDQIYQMQIQFEFKFHSLFDQYTEQLKLIQQYNDEQKQKAEVIEQQIIPNNYEQIEILLMQEQIEKLTDFRGAYESVINNFKLENEEKLEQLRQQIINSSEIEKYYLAEISKLEEKIINKDNCIAHQKEELIQISQLKDEIEDELDNKNKLLDQFTLETLPQNQFGQENINQIFPKLNQRKIQYLKLQKKKLEQMNQSLENLINQQIPPEKNYQFQYFNEKIELLQQQLIEMKKKNKSISFKLKKKQKFNQKKEIQQEVNFQSDQFLKILKENRDLKSKLKHLNFQELIKNSLENLNLPEMFKKLPTQVINQSLISLVVGFF